MRENYDEVTTFFDISVLSNRKRFFTNDSFASALDSCVGC